MDTTNIILIGMPGAGKSTVGVVLAKRIGYHFIDSDILIQEKEGKKLSEIIAEKGTDGFLEVEDRVNSGVRTEHCVIATGGSVVYGENAMQNLKSIGTVVYLWESCENLRSAALCMTDMPISRSARKNLISQVLSVKSAENSAWNDGLLLKEKQKSIERSIKRKRSREKSAGYGRHR